MELRGRSHLKDWLYSEPGNWLSEVTACISVSMQEFGDPGAMKPVTGLGRGNWEAEMLWTIPYDVVKAHCGIGGKGGKGLEELLCVARKWLGLLIIRSPVTLHSKPVHQARLWFCFH